MNNPWKDLPQNAPFILETDKEEVLTFNTKAKPIVKIQHHVLPEPYIGNPNAPVVLLNLNPGYADEDVAYYQTEFVLQLWQKNLFHMPMEYPFYILHPEFDQELGGTMWWRTKLREMIEICGTKKVTKNICCIEYFPYHSIRYKPLKAPLESQRYSFDLVKKAIDNQAVIIVMRSEKSWLTAVPELENYMHLYRLNSKQNVAVSRNNCPEGFSKILEVMG